MSFRSRLKARLGGFAVYGIIRNWMSFLDYQAIFYDPEGTLEVTATVSDVRKAYAATVVHAIEEWRLRLAALGAGYEVIRTDSPFGVPLRKAFATRQRLP